jgi:methionyl-tRNA synthetase
MLMSAGLPVPKTVFSHGFINAGDGRKMSKSFGNVIDPHAMLDLYPADTLRFYLCSEASYGSDVKFSEACLVRNHPSS